MASRRMAIQPSERNVGRVGDGFCAGDLTGVSGPGEGVGGSRWDRVEPEVLIASLFTTTWYL